MEHCYEFMEITGHTLAYNSDEVIETTHGRLRHFEKVHNFTNKRTVSGKSKSISNRSSFNYWNATHAKLNPNNGRIQKKLRKRRQVRYFECDVESSTAAPEAPDYYNPAAPTADRTDRAGAAGEGAEVCTDGDDQTQVSVCSRSQPQLGHSADPNSMYRGPGHFPQQQMSLAQSQLQTISPIPVTAESQASSSGVLTPRPPPAVLQHPIKLCGPQSTEIRLMLQGLKPIPITILTPAISWTRHSPKSDMDTFDASDFLREFNNLQPVDIVAQAMELTLKPTDFNNNNKDLLSQAMEIAEIS